MTLAIAKALIRIASFHRTLGPLFTFVVFIKDDHRLVTGVPYALVRHHSYTCLVMVILEKHLLQFGPNGWVTQCDSVEGARLWLFAHIWGAVSLLQSRCRR
ncbi:hypothetical protein C8T65DRAFT_781561 [Cerioporus squamosus]|nr:hypothetical protein C8T65DRAFT_781561 [Cerioporus squamosus]